MPVTQLAHPPGEPPLPPAVTTGPNPDHERWCNECGQPLETHYNEWGNLLGWSCFECDYETYENGE